MAPFKTLFIRNLKPFVLVVLCFSFFQTISTVASTPRLQYPENAVRENNNAVALMGKYDFQSAVQEFEKLANDYSDIPELKLNLAIAILNRQGPADESKAFSILTDLIKKRPKSG